MEILTESPQSVNLNGENDNCIRDEKVQLQQAHIAELVKKKLDSIHEFGGIQVIAEALGTNLETGMKNSLKSWSFQLQKFRKETEKKIKLKTERELKLKDSSRIISLNIFHNTIQRSLSPIFIHFRGER